MCVFGGRKLSTNGTELRLLVQSLRVTQRAFTHCGRTIDRVLNLGGVDRGSALCSPVPMFPGTYVPRFTANVLNFACVRVRMCVCVCERACACAWGRARLRAGVHACVRACVRACVQMCMCACARACARVHVCVAVCMYVSACMCAYACACAYANARV